MKHKPASVKPELKEHREFLQDSLTCSIDAKQEDSHDQLHTFQQLKELCGHSCCRMERNRTEQNRTERHGTEWNRTEQLFVCNKATEQKQLQQSCLLCLNINKQFVLQ